MGVLYENVDIPNILPCFVVGRPRPEYGLPVAIIQNKKRLYENRSPYSPLKSKKAAETI